MHGVKVEYAYLIFFFFKVIVFAGLTDDNLWDFLCGCRRTYEILVQPFESTHKHNEKYVAQQKTQVILEPTRLRWTSGCFVMYKYVRIS